LSWSSKVSDGFDTISFYLADDQTIQSGGLGNWNALNRDVYVYAGSGLPALPEPAAWTLMLAGFAGLGAALRAGRRRRTPIAAV
jgi:hypothetical protein